MTRTAVARALRKGVALALSLAPPLLTCCGGQTTSPCGVDSSQSMARPCDTISFPFHGTPASCHADSYGAFFPDQCASLCPVLGGTMATGCSVDWSAAPEVINCSYGFCGIGRRPTGLQPPSRVAARTPGGRLLAEIAYLEAASVQAFAVLARDLEEHGAPARLCAASRRAARDEIRHATVMGRLADRAGALVGEVRVERRRRRTLEALAVENAVEGCVGETYGAAVACIQAKRAGDTRFRPVMKRIAADETRHAQLSFELARWFDRRLNAAGRRRVRDARTRAVQALARSVRRSARGTTAFALGLPTADQAAMLIDELRRSLWT